MSDGNGGWRADLLPLALEDLGQPDITDLLHDLTVIKTHKPEKQNGTGNTQH